MNRTASRSSSSQRGSALLAALCFATVLAIALASYITVCHRTLQMSARNMQGTRSVELAEAGMEEALWALNHDSASWTGWTITGSTATKTISGFTYDNGVTGSIAISITNYDGTSGTRAVTVTGAILLADGTIINRTLTSSSAQAPLFVNAVSGTTGRVRFQSGGTVDSYDSSTDINAATIGYSAIVSSGYSSGSTNAVQMTNAQIKGYIATPGSGPSYSTSARLTGPSTPGTTKIDTSRISTSPYQPLFDENVPAGVVNVLPTGTVTVGTPGDTIPAYYTATDVNLGAGKTLTIAGPVVLVVTGDLITSSTGKIVVAATGSLEIHLSGDMSLAGSGIQNLTKLPRKLLILAKADNAYDSLAMSSLTPFHGVIYTPKNALTFSGNVVIYGAIVAKSVTFSASPTIHYDMDLRHETRGVFSGLITPYAISNWQESVDAD